MKDYDAASHLCENPWNTLLLSVGSVWEIEINRQLGKLTLRDPLDRIIEEQRHSNGIVILDVQLPHVLHLASLPPIHKDPFDRILFAQALAESAVLLSSDATVAACPAPVVW